jgi:thioredoxin 1
MAHFDTPIHINDQSLDRVLANPLPVLLFMAEGPLGPALQNALAEVARAEAGKLLVARLDSSLNPEAARRFNAQQGAHLVFWKAGAEEVHLAASLRSKSSPQAMRGADSRQKLRLNRISTPTPSLPTPSPNGDSDRPFRVDERSFEREVLHSPDPVLVDFWAPWCGPCRMIAPVLDRLASEYSGRLRIAKLNVDENPRLASHYGVQGIPHLIIFKGGRPAERIVGAYPEPALRGFIERNIRHTN